MTALCIRNIYRSYSQTPPTKTKLHRLCSSPVIDIISHTCNVREVEITGVGNPPPARISCHFSQLKKPTTQQIPLKAQRRSFRRLPYIEKSVLSSILKLPLDSCLAGTLTSSQSFLLPNPVSRLISLWPTGRVTQRSEKK